MNSHIKTFRYREKRKFGVMGAAMSHPAEIPSSFKRLLFQASTALSPLGRVLKISRLPSHLLRLCQLYNIFKKIQPLYACHWGK